MGGRVMCANAWSILAPSLVEKLILARTCSAVEIEGDAIMVGQTRPGTFSILFTLAVAAWYPTVTLAHGDEAPAQAVSLSGENYDPVSRGTRKLALGEDVQHFAAHIARGACDDDFVTHLFVLL